MSFFSLQQQFRTIRKTYILMHRKVHLLKHDNILIIVMKLNKYIKNSLWNKNQIILIMKNGILKRSIYGKTNSEK